MKGTSFQKPLEFKLSIEGETWNQGDSISGVLTVKSHSVDPVAVSGVRVVLAHGDLNDIRKKSADAFALLNTFSIEDSGRLIPQAEKSFSWKFETDRNCPITDKSSSLFILYGSGESNDKLGQLQLIVNPTHLIHDFVNRMVIDFKFVVKSMKHSHGSVEVKFAPPSARAFSKIEKLSVFFRFEEDHLAVRYVFGVKKLDAAAGMALKKEKQEFEQAFGPNQYLLGNGRLNHDRVEAAIKEVLDQLGLGTVL